MPPERRTREKIGRTGQIGFAKGNMGKGSADNKTTVVNKRVW